MWQCGEKRARIFLPFPLQNLESFRFRTRPGKLCVVCVVYKRGNPAMRWQGHWTQLQSCEQFLTSLHSHRRANFAVKDLVPEPEALLTSHIFSKVVLLCAFLHWCLLCGDDSILTGQGGEVYLVAFRRLPCCLGWTAGERSSCRNQVCCNISICLQDQVPSRTLA